VVAKCPTVITEKVAAVQVSGIRQVLHTITLTTKKRLLMVSGDLVEVMVTTPKTVMHTTTVMVVLAVLSSSITLKNYELRINQ
jgi:hypothetical protein